MFQLYEAQDVYKEYADRHSKEQPNFNIEDLVWLLRRNIQTKKPSRKLDYQRLGPFTITNQVNPANYHLELPSTIRIHLIFHVSLFEPYNESQIPRRIFPPPLPIEIDQEIEYEVEEILNLRICYGYLNYYIHWKGYNISERT